MGKDSISRVRLHEGTRWQGSSLPYVRPYRTLSLGPKILDGACRRPFYCSEQPESGLGRPQGAHNALKWPKITQNGSPVPHPTIAHCRPTTANRHQLPTINRQPQPTANCHQPPTDNQATWAQKWSKMSMFKSGPRSLGMGKRNLRGPFLACSDPF